jgi:hypothetical protein
MLLSHHYKFVFIRPLKTAGSSAEFALSGFLEPGDYSSTLPDRESLKSRVKPGVRVGSSWFWPRSRLYRPVRLRSHAFLEHVYAVFPEEVQSYKVISMTRNPWDRAVSRFFYHMRRTNIRERQFTTQKAAFIRFTHQYGPHTWLDNFLRMKRERALDNSRRLYFVNGRCRTDYVIRFERIEQDMNGLQDFLGLPTQPTVEEVRLKSNTRPSVKKHRWMDFYDDQTRELVADCCQWEIEKFGYDFEGKNEPNGPYISNSDQALRHEAA